MTKFISAILVSISFAVSAFAATEVAKPAATPAATPATTTPAAPAKCDPAKDKTCKVEAKKEEPAKK
tara:strand:- start:453 stop:653 length:201 start_codon:yes stop_codon:yes gene_type:complete